MDTKGNLFSASKDIRTITIVMQANRRIVMVQGKCHGHPSCDSNGGSGDEVDDAHCQGHGHPACDRDGGRRGGIDDSIGCDCDVNGAVMLMIV